MLTATAQREWPLHGVVSWSLRFDRLKALLIAVRYAVNIWRIKEPQKAPWISVKLWYLKHTPHLWDKTGYSLQGNCYLTSHKGNWDVQGIMWQIIYELCLSLSSWGVQIAEGKHDGDCCWTNIGLPRVGYMLYSVWQRTTFKSLWSWKYYSQGHRQG